MPVDDHEFGAFFISHYGWLYALGVLLTGDRGQAEELAQDAQVRTYRRWALVGPPDEPASFARSTATGRCCAAEWSRHASCCGWVPMPSRSSTSRRMRW